MIAVFGQLNNDAILNGTLSNTKRRGFLGQGVATLVAGAGVPVTPVANATAVTDRWQLYDSTVGAGAAGAPFIGTITAGIAGVGGFVINSSAAATDAGVVGFVQYDTTQLT
jgi:hypothetical protein